MLNMSKINTNCLLIGLRCVQRGVHKVCGPPSCIRQYRAAKLHFVKTNVVYHPKSSSTHVYKPTVSCQGGKQAVIDGQYAIT